MRKVDFFFSELNETVKVEYMSDLISHYGSGTYWIFLDRLISVTFVQKNSGFGLHFPAE